MVEFPLSDSQNCAIVAAIVNTTRRFMIGRVSIQQIAYLAQKAGVSVDYQIDLYGARAHCSELKQDIKYLLHDDVIKDVSREPDKYSIYKPGRNTGWLLKKYDGKEINRAINVVKDLGDLDHRRIDVMMTIDFFYRNEISIQPDKPIGYGQLVELVCEKRHSGYERRGEVENALASMQLAGVRLGL